MKLFDVILKLILTLGLTSSTEEYQMLNKDVKAWELDATRDSEDKLKQLYYKLHKGVLFRLATPFLYFFILREVKSMMSPDEEDEF